MITPWMILPLKWCKGHSSIIERFFLRLGDLLYNIGKPPLRHYQDTTETPRHHRDASEMSVRHHRDTRTHPAQAGSREPDGARPPLELNCGYDSWTPKMLFHKDSHSSFYGKKTHHNSRQSHHKIPLIFHRYSTYDGFIQSGAPSSSRHDDFPHLCWAGSYSGRRREKLATKFLVGSAMVSHGQPGCQKYGKHLGVPQMVVPQNGMFIVENRQKNGW